MYQKLRKEIRQILEALSIEDLEMIVQLGSNRLILEDGHIVGYEKEPTLLEQE